MLDRCDWTPGAQEGAPVPLNYDTLAEQGVAYPNQTYRKYAKGLYTTRRETGLQHGHGQDRAVPSALRKLGTGSVAVLHRAERRQPVQDARALPRIRPGAHDRSPQLRVLPFGTPPNEDHARVPSRPHHRSAFRSREGARHHRRRLGVGGKPSAARRRFDKAMFNDTLDPRVVSAEHGWWFPEHKPEAPSLFGTFDCNINNLTPQCQNDQCGFGAPNACQLCKMYKVTSENSQITPGEIVTEKGGFSAMSNNTYGLMIDYEYCNGLPQLRSGLQEGTRPRRRPVGASSCCLTDRPKKPDGEYELKYIPLPTAQCDLCEDRVAMGKLPTCVHHCQSRTMSWGTLKELAQEMEGRTNCVLFTADALRRERVCGRLPLPPTRHPEQAVRIREAGAARIPLSDIPALIAGNAGHRASVRGCAHPARWWSFPNKATCMPVHAAAQTCPKRNGRGAASWPDTGLVCANPCGKAKTPNPGKNYLACGWHTPVEKKARRPQAHEETERSQEKRCGMCFRPTAVEGGTICPNCGEQLSTPPGVNMSKCPVVRRRVARFERSPCARRSWRSARGCPPQAPGAPGAPAAPKAPSAPEPPTA